MSEEQEDQQHTTMYWHWCGCSIPCSWGERLGCKWKSIVIGVLPCQVKYQFSGYVNAHILSHFDNFLQNGVISKHNAIHKAVWIVDSLCPNQTLRIFKGVNLYWLEPNSNKSYIICLSQIGIWSFPTYWEQRILSYTSNNPCFSVQKTYQLGKRYQFYFCPFFASINCTAIKVLEIFASHSHNCCFCLSN